MRVINIRHKIHTLLSSNLRQYVNSDESENFNFIFND